MVKLYCILFNVVYEQGEVIIDGFNGIMMLFMFEVVMQIVGCFDRVVLEELFV